MYKRQYYNYLFCFQILNVPKDILDLVEHQEEITNRLQSNMPRRQSEADSDINTPSVADTQHSKKKKIFSAL